MHVAIRSQKELWLGVLYLAFGAAGMWYSFDYPMGSAARMGPGYLPCLVSGILLVFGAGALVRSVRIAGEDLGRIAFRPLLHVVLGVVAFAVLAERAGLLLSLVALIVISAAGSREFRLGWVPVFGMLAFIAFCAGIFVTGLHVPLPLFGTWFGR